MTLSCRTSVMDGYSKDSRWPRVIFHLCLGMLGMIILCSRMCILYSLEIGMPTLFILWSLTLSSFECIVILFCHWYKTGCFFVQCHSVVVMNFSSDREKLKNKGTLAPTTGDVERNAVTSTWLVTRNSSEAKMRHEKTCQDKKTAASQTNVCWKSQSSFKGMKH